MPTQAERQLRTNGMMAHLLDALDDGKDIGHYGRLVFTMVASKFMGDSELLRHLRQDRSFGEDEAKALVQQVRVRDYNPPRRQRILEWQARQDFPICPNPDDPDACNVYKDLTFPDGVYDDIEEYHEQKAEAAAS